MPNVLRVLAALLLLSYAQAIGAQELPRRDARALEQFPDAITSYESVRSPLGYRVRTVVTRPRSATAGRLPGILFIPWLSCDPVERAEPGNDGFAHMLHDVARGSEMLMLRVEKPGNGDSEGPSCAEGRLNHELAAYRAALTALRSRSDVDTNRIVIIGGSLGGGIAPILAAERPDGVIGVISVGGFTRTWYEHMLDLERARLTLSGRSPAEVNIDLRRFAEFYVDYLYGKRTPGDVIAGKPHFRELWPDAAETQYGRHARFYHAVAELNVEDAWAKLAERGIPALLVWGEYDWIMSRAEQERAIAILNANGRDLGALAILSGVGHGLMSYASALDAFRDRNPAYRGEPGRVVNDWLRALVRRHRVLPSARQR